jgi:hypothetical protein
MTLSVKTKTYLFISGVALISNVDAFPTAAEVALAQSKNNKFIEQYCSTKAKIFTDIKEQIASAVKVHPNSLDLKRTDVAIDAWDGRQIKSCVGYFYHTNGVTKCALQFNQSGIIANACNLGDKSTYSEILRNAASERTDAEIKEMNKDYKGVSKDWDIDQYGQSIKKY